MHPIERIRALARASWLDAKTVAIEAADAIGDAYMWMDEAAAVSVARRLLAWHPYCGPLWLVCGEVLYAVDPVRASRDAIEHLLDDSTGLALDIALPEGSRPYLVGRCRAMDELGDGGGARSLRDATHLVVGASVMGPTGLVSHSPAAALVAEAAHAGMPVWAVAEIGTAVDARLWQRLAHLVDDAFVQPPTTAISDLWWDEHDTDAPEPCCVGLDALTWVCGPEGLEVPAEAAAAGPPTPADLLDAAGAPAF